MNQCLYTDMIKVWYGFVFVYIICQICIMWGREPRIREPTTTRMPLRPPALMGARGVGLRPRFPPAFGLWGNRSLTIGLRPALITHTKPCQGIRKLGLCGWRDMITHHVLPAQEGIREAILSNHGKPQGAVAREYPACGA